MWFAKKKCKSAWGNDPHDPTARPPARPPRPGRRKRIKLDQRISRPECDLQKKKNKVRFCWLVFFFGFYDPLLHRSCFVEGLGPSRRVLGTSSLASIRCQSNIKNPTIIVFISKDDFTFLRVCRTHLKRGIRTKIWKKMNDWGLKICKKNIQKCGIVNNGRPTR